LQLQLKQLQASALLFAVQPQPLPQLQGTLASLSASFAELFCEEEQPLKARNPAVRITEKMILSINLL
jgi:hypothetical protein